ncbi:MAG: hypothetical protein MI753_07365 [Hyphomicrobiales bacterium]|nr:hypothetical protein [Hyphomicrobiales bacterium]
MDTGAIGKSVSPLQAEPSLRPQPVQPDATPTELTPAKAVRAIERHSIRSEAVRPQKERPAEEERPAREAPQRARPRIADLRSDPSLTAANLDPAQLEWGPLDEATERRLAALDAYPPINASSRSSTGGGQAAEAAAPREAQAHAPETASTSPQGSASRTA